MSYVALYRKARPSVFDDVKGQDHIVTTLKNQVMAGRIQHAYLFCGTRGTGKTSIAKIMAKVVNCENPVNGNPCNECASCRQIAAGNSMNVIEIDAASNNGVDNIREIVEEVRYRPTQGKYKVYIIDEVHMLSQGAFNALLKTLEEPPSYVVFILATTEVGKIPVTILSRCQRYDFHRIDAATLVSRMRELVQREGVEAEERALQFIARSADGSMYHSPDDTEGDKGGNDELDNEIITVDLNKVSGQISQIFFFLNIFSPRNIDFMKIPYVSIRMFEGTPRKVNSVFAQYDVAKEPQFAGKDALIMGKLYRRNGEWKFAAIGEAFSDQNDLRRTIKRILDSYAR